MSTVNEDAGTDIGGEILLKRRDLIATMNNVGVYGVCLFAMLSFLFTSVWVSRCEILDLSWGGLGIHILLAAGAVLLLGPMAAIVYRLLHDILGVKKSICMKTHAFVQIMSTIFGISAVQASYAANEEPSLAYLETGSYYVYHFRSSHSILGIFMLGIYAAQLAAALYIYFIGSKQLRAEYKQLHMAVGQGLVVVMLYVAALGMMYFESLSYNLGWDDVGLEGYYRPYMTIAQYCIVFLMFSIILVFYAKILV